MTDGIAPLRASPFLDTVVRAPFEPPTMFRLRVYRGRGPSPVVVLAEITENPGRPVPEVVEAVAEHIRRGFLRDCETEPVWIEAWLGRALAALVRDRIPATAYMLVDLSASPPTRRPLSARELEALLA